MSFDGEVIVLRDEVSLDDLLQLAAEQGWVLRGETARAHLVLASRRWTSREGVELTYVADHPGGAHSVRIVGKASSRVARNLRERVSAYSEDELLAVVLDHDPPDPVACIRVASKLAACRPELADARHLQAIEVLLAHPEPAVRRAGIRSTYGCRWPELRNVVDRRLAQEDRFIPQLEHLQRHLAPEPTAD
ncbi:MAG: hypothetical protein AAF799_13995 [Myxococcota bacterium]